MADIFSNQDEHNRQEQAEGRDGEGRGVELGETNPSGLTDAREVNLTLDNRSQVADQHADQDGEAAENTLKENSHKADRHNRHNSRDRSLLHPVPCGGSQIQTDERHDRARHHRRHHRVNPMHAREVDDQADERERRTHRDDAAERVGRTQGPRHRLDRRNQREGRPQVRGQTTRRNQEKQQRADRGEKKRC